MSKVDPGRGRTVREAPVRTTPAILVGVGGVVIVLGSMSPWEYRDSFFGGFALTGMDAGPGVVTAVIGLALAALGIAAARRHGCTPFGPEAVGLAVLAFLIAVASQINLLLRASDFRYWVWNEGEILVAGGAILASAGGVRLPHPDEAARAWARARRPALGLMLAGLVAWALGLNEFLGHQVAPLTYAVVLMALGVGHWPAPFPAVRIQPTSFGTLIALYGAVALAAALFVGAGPSLLGIMPFVVLVAIGVMRVLDLPTRAPQDGSPPGAVDAALAAVASLTALRVAAVLLISGPIVLLVTRLVPGWGLPAWVDGGPWPTDPAWTWWLLAVGLVIAFGVVSALIRGLGRTPDTAAR